MLTIKWRTKFKLMTRVFKVLQGNGLDYLETKLKTKTYQRTTRRSTANCITLNVIFIKGKTYGDYELTHTAVSHWNNFPESI